MQSDDPVERTSRWARAGGHLFGRSGRIARLALLAAVAIGAAWLLTPGGYAERMPGDDALGSPAVGTFKASRDLEVLDAAATERLRTEAAAAERTVWSFDEGALEEAAVRVRGAFHALRDGWRDSRRIGAAERGRFEARLGAPVREEDLEALARARFSPEAESQVVALAARALSGLVVEDRARVGGEAERGIVVRNLRAGLPQGEHALHDLAILRDVAAAREDVARATEGLPTRWPPAERAAVARIAGALVRPTLVLDGAETAERRRAAAGRVRPVTLHVRRGEKIVGDGEPIERRHLVLFRGI
ncbi:MAG: phosphohydrolase, partial [Anaeromyxobacteraceae bacterium]